MDDKLFMPLTSPLDSLLALRDALTDAVQSPGKKALENQSSSSTAKPTTTTLIPQNSPTCASTLTGDIPLSGRRKLQYQPGPLNVSYINSDLELLVNFFFCEVISFYKRLLFFCLCLKFIKHSWLPWLPYLGSLFILF